MKIRNGRLFTNLTMVLAAALAFAAGRCGAENLPPGSLVMHGPSMPAKATETISMNSAMSPEYLLGLKIQSAMLTNGQNAIVESFDLGGLFQRFIPTLPASDEAKKQLFGLQNNGVWRRMIFKDAVGDLAGTKVQFLGIRVYHSDCELLFRGLANAFDDPRYVGYMTQREPDGSVRLVDAHIFQHGQLLSEILRREMLLDAARKKLIAPPFNAHDEAFFSANKAVALFETRCDYGHYNLVQQAYEQLPAVLQSDREVLYRFATTGEIMVKEMVEPVEQWRKAYPDDPSPNLLLLNFYWKLYRGPRLIPDGPQKGLHLEGGWFSDQEKNEATAVAERANVFFGDPVMELRLAHTFEAERARPLLQQAVKRVPANPDAFAELLKVDLAAKDFGDAAATLRLEEVAFRTNLTVMVSASTNFAEFRDSFQWKKWQHDYHGADAKALTDASAK